jgi:hypothetical protein
LPKKKNFRFQAEEAISLKEFTITKKGNTEYLLNFTSCRAEIVAGADAGTVLMALTRDGLSKATMSSFSYIRFLILIGILHF